MPKSVMLNPTTNSGHAVAFGYDVPFPSRRSAKLNLLAKEAQARRNMIGLTYK